MNTQTKPTFEFPDMNSSNKLRELILYVSRRCQTDEGFSLSKLAKILYYADFLSYRNYNKPITGYPYVHWDYGPVPEDYYGILDEMISSNELVITPQRYYGKEQKRPLALRETDGSLFSGRDIKIVEDIIQQYWDKNATETSEESHGIAWKMTEHNARIPYQASLLSSDDLTDEEIAHAIELAREYGLD